MLRSTRRKRLKDNNRRLKLESLEARAMLTVSGTMPAISGTVFQDLDMDGIVDPGEQLEGVTIRLFVDNGDGVFVPGGGEDTEVAQFTTLANGEYCFDNLDPTLSYWVVQQAQTISTPSGDVNLEQVRFLCMPGTPGTTIDDFETTQMINVVGNAPPTRTQNDTINPGNGIGPRTLEINMTNSGSSMSQMNLGVVDLNFGAGADFGGVLTFNADSGVSGTFESSWSALGSTDLTDGGDSSGLYMLAGVDANGGNMTVTVDSSGGATSTSSVTIPQTNQGRPEQFVFIPFSSFTGTADLTQIDAVSILIGGSQPVDGNISLLGTLRPKVQNFSNEPFEPSIDIEKLTNAIDADTQAEGPNIAVGEQVTWLYQIENTGNVNLTNVVVSDSDLGVIGSGNIVNRINSNSDNILEPGEIWVYQTTGTAVAGDYMNLGTVNAQDPAGGQQQDSDPSHYFGVEPMIQIEKTTNNIDADTAPGPMVAVGSTVTWRYIVTNSGNDDLTNVVVTDDQIGIIGTLISQTNGNTDAILEPGEIWTYEATGTATAGQYTNLGSVTARNSAGGQETAEDPSNYFGNQPNIEIEKFTNEVDADVMPGPTIAVGSGVLWTYRVTNTGNVDLSSISVTDDQIGAITNLVSQSGDTDLILEPGEVWTYQATGTATAGQYANIGTVDGFDPSGARQTDTDPSHYFGSQPAIDIEKATNGEDADQDENRVTLNVGSTVTWTYVVTNTGNEDITNVVVSDDVLGAITNLVSQTNGDTDNVLEPGEVWTYQATGTATAGQYRNVGTVNGTSNGSNVSDEDPSNYFGIQPQIQIEKDTNGFDADLSADAPRINAGNGVTWTYVVTNPGNDPITNVLVSDNVLGNITNRISQSNGNTDEVLDPGEVWTYQATGVATAGLYSNIGTVNGRDSRNTSLSDTDPSHYFGSLASIDIEKATNGIDADLAAQGPTLFIGDTVTWTYVVTNTGNEDLNNVQVTDNRIGAITNITNQGDGDTTLGPGETWTYQATGTVSEGAYENLGSVVANSVGGMTVQDQDLSHYLGEELLYSISGFVYIDIDNDGDQDTFDPPLANVQMELLDASMAPVAFTSTNSFGFYEFDGLQPGEYTVRERQPIGLSDGIDQRGETGEEIAAGLNAPGVDELMARIGIADDDDLDGDRDGEVFNFGEILSKRRFLSSRLPEA